MNFLRKQNAQVLVAFLTVMLVFPVLTSCNEQQDTATTETPAAESPIPDNTIVQEPASLPQQPFSVPGWLAFATKPQKEGKSQLPFSPTNPEAQIAIFSDEWAQVEPGTTLVAVAPEFKETVEFGRAQNEPYGCDDTPTPMATFSASQTIPEGAVWLLPQSQADAATALPIETLSLDRVPDTLLPLDKRVPIQAQAWKAGNYTILLQKTGDNQAKLTLANNAEEIFTTEATHSSIPGSYEEPLDFSTPFQPGIPKPVGAFQFQGSETPLIVLWKPSFEGHGFQVIAPKQGGVELVDVGSVYYCAF